MRTRFPWLGVLIALTVSSTAWGCEPIVPLVKLLGGASLAGPLFLTQSLSWLVAAVIIKCGAFVFLERRLPWREAVPYMVLANMLSTIPGVLVAVCTSSGGGVLVALPVVFVLGKLVEGRLSHLYGPGQKRGISGGKAVAAFMGFFILSVALFGVAGSLLDGGDFRVYWLVKFLFVAMAATTGILISAVLEEYVIARLSRKDHGNLSFFKSVIRANYITLGLVLLVAALEMLPKRLNAPHFIVSWLHWISSLAGLSLS